MMLMLRPYVPQLRPNDTEPSLMAVIKWNNSSYTRHIENVKMQHPDNYEAMLRHVWGQDDLIIIEHDIVPTFDDLQGLIHCACPVCVGAYYLYPPVSGTKQPVVAHRKVMPDSSHAWLEYGEEWADIVSMGLIKISREAQRMCSFNDLIWGSWDNLDIRLSKLLRDSLHRELPFHVHWPIVEHRHWRG